MTFPRRPVRLQTIPPRPCHALYPPVFPGRPHGPERAVTRFVAVRLAEQPDDTARAQRGR